MPVMSLLSPRPWLGDWGELILTFSLLRLPEPLISAPTHLRGGSEPHPDLISLRVASARVFASLYSCKTFHVYSHYLLVGKKAILVAVMLLAVHPSTGIMRGY